MSSKSGLKREEECQLQKESSKYQKLTSLLSSPQQPTQQMPLSSIPVTQGAGQQNAPGTVSVSQPAVATPASSTNYEEKRKLIQQQLVLLLHANKCMRRENQSNGEVRQCLLPNCRTMKHVLVHMTTCQAVQSCAVPHCSSSRQIIIHWKNCTRCDCPVCMPLKQASDRQQQAVNDQAPQYSPQNLNHIQTPQAAQSQVQLRQLLQNSSTGAIPSQSAENFLYASSNQATPVVLGVTPDNPTTVKDWHQYVTQDKRHHLVLKIVQAIFPTTDISTLQDTRMDNLVAYAMKVEGDMYGAANSREEYYQLLAEKIYKIRKELEEKKRDANAASCP